MRRYWQFLALSLFTGVMMSPELSASPRFEFHTKKAQEHYQKLTTQLRCLVCQNQTLADSFSPLALDLKQEIFEQVQAGETFETVMNIMVARYGEYVRYEPPFAPGTLILWLGPIVLLVVSGLWVRKSFIWL